VAVQLPFVDDLFLLLLTFNIIKRTTAPDNKRIDVKLEASIVFSPNAIRQSTELAAKAISAKTVKVSVFINSGKDPFIKEISSGEESSGKSNYSLSGNSTVTF
jgi:hypothetical protein